MSLSEICNRSVIVTADDLLEIIADPLDGLAEVTSSEQTREARSRS